MEADGDQPQMRGGWPGGLDDETTVFLIFFKTKLKFLLYVKAARIKSSMLFCNEFRWMIFLEMTFLYHVMYLYMTIKLEMLEERETSDMYLLKVTFSFSINTGRRAGGGGRQQRGSSNTNHSQDTALSVALLLPFCV